MSLETTGVSPAAHEADPDIFYIRTPASLADDRNLVLKEGETFVVLDRYGDISPVGLGEEGLYHRGTRYLSELSVRIGGRRALLLSSAVRQDNTLIAVDQTNLDMEVGGVAIPRGTVHVSRTLVLWDGALHERLTAKNYGALPLSLPITIVYGADYADIFEVRGAVRPARGDMLAPVIDDRCVVLAYRGRDGVIRRTRIVVRPWPIRVTSRQARLDLLLAPHSEEVFEIEFGCEERDARAPRIAFSAAAHAASETLAARRSGICEIETSNTQFNEWLRRSVSDLAMMTTDTTFGPYPYAGVPWFSTPFGRDALVTAFQCLWAAPGLARGVLSFLAATQATRTNDVADAQPGKILHEARDGEMAALGEIPFGRYYGSHDATPLFVALAEAYYERTGDRATIERLWRHIEAALGWIDRDGDLDGDGFVEYLRQSPTGLVHQGWKDSHDSVFHRDGEQATGPIALCEIQGYVYAAWRGASRLARSLGRTGLSESLAAKAATLRAKFEEAFWCPEIGTYALALDGVKRPCAVVSSNAGHALLTGIAGHSHAGEVVRSLMSSASYSGWGIRTIAAGESRYNPMAYHNGSVWPHDNALIANGFARYDFREEAMLVLNGLFEASVHMDLHRLPELFCGFSRRAGESPVQYPVACAPQAWSSGAVFLLLRATLGLDVFATDRLVRFTRARLPAYLDEVRIKNLRVGPATLDLLLERHHQNVSIDVMRRDGEVEIVSIK